MRFASGNCASCAAKMAMLFLFQARVAELVDALDLGSSANGMGVQIPPLVPSYQAKGAFRGL